MRKTLGKPKLRDILQYTWPASWSVKVIKNIFLEPKKTWQLIVSGVLDGILEQKKDIRGKTSEIQIKYEV